jgi:hypothetical protein
MWGLRDEAEHRAWGLRRWSPGQYLDPAFCKIIRLLDPMFGSTISVALALLSSAVAAPPRNNAKDLRPFSLAAETNNNGSLVDALLDPVVPIFSVALGPPSFGHNPDQRRLPDIFKRAVCSNYCGPTQSAPSSYCGCGQVCCSGGGCCGSASGEICCGSVCCTNGATCSGNTCRARTYVVPVVSFWMAANSTGSY